MTTCAHAHAEIREWQARQEKCRAAYRAQPLAICLGVLTRKDVEVPCENRRFRNDHLCRSCRAHHDKEQQ